MTYDNPKFAGLVPELRPWASWLYYVAEVNGLHPIVTSVYRSAAKQQQLYERFLAGKSPLPAAPPGKSKHQYGLAFDMVTDNAAALGAVWNSVGGRWFASDPVHFEV